jgi:ABC-type glycerol-3-phosphate transport system permease component
MEIVKNVNTTVVAVAVIIYNFLIIAGAAYLCAVYDWSFWTMLCAFFFTISFKDKE